MFTRFVQAAIVVSLVGCAAPSTGDMMTGDGGAFEVYVGTLTRREGSVESEIGSDVRAELYPGSTLTIRECVIPLAANALELQTVVCDGSRVVDVSIWYDPAYPGVLIDVTMRVGGVTTEWTYDGVPVE